MKEEIYEAALEEENLRSARGNAGLIASYGTAESGVSRLTESQFDMGRVWGLLGGAIDIHIHSGPCANSARSYDELEMAIQACQAGMKAVVYKCGSMPSARSAYIVQKVVNQWAEEHGKRKLDVFGGVVLNYCVGGLNPEAVLTSFRVGGKFVWLPNKDASFHRKIFGTPGGIEVLDENDQVVPPLREIFALIAEGDMVLSLCHQSTKERFILIDEAKKMGIKRIELMHPTQVTARMTVEQMKIAADKGACIGFYCVDFDSRQWSWEVFLEALKIVGVDRLIAATDSGPFDYPSPVEAMRLFITGMLTRGISDKDVEKMVKTNPATLLY